jgi:hypothetical protein
MRTVWIALAACTAALAQQWEFGGTAGGGFLKNAQVSGAAGTASAGFQSGAVFGGYVAQNLYRRVSGELRYNFQAGDMALSAGGSKASFAAVSHAVHYDLLFHTQARESRPQYFVAAGGGVRVFRGTGREAAYQELSQHAIFTKTQAAKPMASIGGGVKIPLKPNLWLRTEVRDYITPFPVEVITPAPGSKVRGLLHDLVPMAGISFTF